VLPGRFAHSGVAGSFIVSVISNISNVEIEFYRLFPADSVNPPSGNVPTRAGSPADVEIGSATREFAAGLRNCAGLVIENRLVALCSERLPLRISTP
jgi:hypothetical protein